MTEINFQPVFDYIDETADRLREDMRTEFRGEIYEVKNMIANLVTQGQVHQEEFMISSHRHTRVEAWAKVAGDKIGIPFNT